jgi:hypothetical protein
VSCRARQAGRQARSGLRHRAMPPSAQARSGRRLRAGRAGEGGGGTGMSGTHLGPPRAASARTAQQLDSNRDGKAWRPGATGWACAPGRMLSTEACRAVDCARHLRQAFTPTCRAAPALPRVRAPRAALSMMLSMPGHSGRLRAGRRGGWHRHVRHASRAGRRATVPRRRSSSIATSAKFRFAQASNSTGGASIGTPRCGKRCTSPAWFCSTATTSSSATWTPRGCCFTPSAAASHAAWPLPHLDCSGAALPCKGPPDSPRLLPCSWMRDPLPYFTQQHTQFDYFTATDNLHSKNPVGDEGPEAEPNAWSGFNTGGRPGHSGAELPAMARAGSAPAAAPAAHVSSAAARSSAPPQGSTSCATPTPRAR